MPCCCWRRDLESYECFFSLCLSRFLDSRASYYKENRQIHYRALLQEQDLQRTLLLSRYAF